MFDKTKIVAYTILFLGAGLLIFAFFNAYLLLGGVLSIMASPNLIEVFGQALAPLIEACIRAVYLGIMGWVGSILTVRGIQSLAQVKREVKEIGTFEARAITEPEVPVVSAKSTKRKKGSRKSK